MQGKSRIRWLAVMAGSLLDQVLTLIIGGVALGAAPEAVDGRFFASSAGAVVGVLLALATVVGGGLAGLIAKEERFLHGFMVGGVGIVLLLLGSMGGSTVTVDMLVLQFIATGLAGVAGYSSRWAPVRQQK